MQIIYTVYRDLIRYYFCLIAGSKHVGKWQKCYTHETNIIILRSWIPCEENFPLPYYPLLTALYEAEGEICIKLY